MRNLHLLIFGNTEEEIRANCLAALEDALHLHKQMGDEANCLGEEFEFDFVEEDTMCSLYDAILKDRDAVMKDFK